MVSEETGLWATKLSPPDNLSFLAPDRLWWLVAVAGLGIAYLVSQFVRRRNGLRFANVAMLDKVAPRRPDWSRHISAVLSLVGLSGLVAAYAEPAALVEVPSERATVMLAIDTSLSMLADDVSPSRIDGAKAAASAFVGEVPEQINVGLVSFNGNAQLRVPPTPNRTAVLTAIDSLQLGEATAIGEAIFVAVRAIEDFVVDFDGDAPPARVVLMSDGETTVGREDSEAVEAARLAGIAVSTIAFGTDRGYIELPDDPGLIAVPVNETALADIAANTGGDFFEAATTEELTEIYADIGSAIATEEQRSLVSSWFAGRAMIVLILAGGFGIALNRRFP